MANPTRFTSGVSTVTPVQSLANYPNPSPTKVYTDFTDFNQYVAADWTVTNTAAHGTAALIAGLGGQLSLAGGGSSVTNDIVAVQNLPLDFNFTAGQQVWFTCSIKCLTALNNQLQVGLTSSNAALTPTDGIYFNKAAATASIDFVVRKASTSTTITSVATVVDNTFIQLGFYYNGGTEVSVFVNDAKVASTQVLTNLPTATALGVGFGVKAAATAPTTSNIVADWVLASQDR